MAHGVKIGNDSASAAAAAVCARMDGGTLVLYDGTKPANGDTAPGGDCHILSQHVLADPCVSGVVNGVATFTPPADDTDADATADAGGASWFRVVGAADEIGWDGTIGVQDLPTPGDRYDIEMPTTAIQQHATVTVPSFTYTASKG